MKIRYCMLSGKYRSQCRKRQTTSASVRFSRRWASETTLPHFVMTVNFSLSLLFNINYI